MHRKLIHPNGHIEERVIWAVPESMQYPEGIRYRLVYVHRPGGEILALYDNHYPKGHHRHFLGAESAYVFLGMEKLMEDFANDIEEVIIHESA